MKHLRLSRNDTITLIRSLITVQQGDYLLSELLFDFKNEVGYPIPAFGHKTVLDFLKSIPGTLRVFTEDNNVYVQLCPCSKSSYIGATFLKSGLLPEQEETYFAPRGKEDKNPCNDSGKIEKQKSTKKTETGKKKSERGYLARIAALMLSLTTDREKYKRIGRRFYILYCDSCEKGEYPITDPIVDRFLSSITLFEDSIPFINVAYYAEVGDDIEITVTEVCNPHCFFMQLKKQKNEFRKIMDLMQAFYTVYGDKYSVKSYEFKKGQFCAALYDTNPECSEWYRAIILRFRRDITTVFLIDYGITADIKNSNLKFLEKSFGQLPRQAFYGKLANIRPCDSRYWSEKCCRRFYSLVFEEELVASVVNIDSKKPMMTMYMSYGDRGNLRIHSTLLREKLAALDRGADTRGSAASYVYESVPSKGWLEPEEIGKVRTPKSVFLYSD